MRRLDLGIFVLMMLPVLLPLAACAKDPLQAPMAGEGCLAAITAAERSAALPTRLLHSIALVESGWRDPATSRVVPWPWTINAEGTGRFFATKAEAVQAAESLRSRGVRSLDVGCAQVNLAHHPEAFDSLEAAFEPQTNADYAARFLLSLKQRFGRWPLAVAAYHSATPSIGDAYARKVMVVWPDAARHGPWPAGGTDGKGAEYSVYTPDFVQRLLRMDADRARRLRPLPGESGRAGQFIGQPTSGHSMPAPGVWPSRLGRVLPGGQAVAARHGPRDP